MVEYVTLKLFYPMLFTTIIILGIIAGLVIVKCKDSKLFHNIFTKSSDNAKEVTLDTTKKMKDMHDNIVHVQFGVEHEQELDTIERKIDIIEKRNLKMEQDIIEMNRKLDIFIAKVLELEGK